MIPLFVPGPVTVADDVRQAQARPAIYHRGQQYGAMLREVSSMLAEILGTAGDVHCVSGSGTATIEMAVRNLCRSGDRMIVPTNGYFGERLAELCRRLGLDVVHLAAGWTEPLPVPAVEFELRRGAVALVAVHHETSTGRVNNVGALGALCRKYGVLSIIDAVSSAGVLPVEMDHHGLDVVLATSQKGIGGTPGVGVLAASEAAWRRIDSLPPPDTLAGDWTKVRRSFRRDPPESQWTPPVSVMAGLHASLQALTRHASPAETFAGRAAIGRAVRAGLESIDFSVWPAGAVETAPVSVAEPPDGVACTELIAAVQAICGVTLGSGQGPLSGRVVRVTHLGISLYHVLGLLGTVELGLQETCGLTHSKTHASAWRAYVGEQRVPA